jgi:hypothetical protein
MRDDVRILREQIIARIVANRTHDVHSTREIVCVEQVAKAGNIRLLEIFLEHVDGDHSLRGIKNAFDEITVYSEESPRDLINDHGMRMRDIIQSELGDLLFKNVTTQISIFAMGLTENEVQAVVGITRRGILDVDKIKEILEETRTGSPTLRDGAL